MILPRFIIALKRIEALNDHYQKTLLDHQQLLFNVLWELFVFIENTHQAIQHSPSYSQIVDA